SNPEFFVRLKEPHRAPGNRRDRREALFAGLDLGVVNAMRRLQRPVWPEDRRDHCREIADKSPPVVKVRATRMAEQHGRSNRDPATVEIGVNNSRIDRLQERPLDHLRPSLIGFSSWRRRRWLTLCTDDLVDLVAGGLVVPAVQLPKQDHSHPGAALAANVGAGAVPIVEAEPIFAAAERAWAVLVGQEPRLDPEPSQDLAPAVAGAFDRAHAAPAALPCALAKAIWRERTQERTVGSGMTGSALRHDGHAPNFSRYL